MPRQFVVCGRPVPRLGSRHVSLLLVCVALLALFGLTSIPGAARVYPNFSVPKSLKSPWMNKLNPFKPPSRPPARQRNDTDGESSWYADWHWLLMPFSSSVTLDEERALLPPLRPRTSVYCYYDNTLDKDPASRDAESDLLLAWRRAWWAQGFKPVILSPAEAMNNPLYEEVQKVEDMAPALKKDLMRWLAWDNMGDGVLASHLLFPMGPHDDPLLTFLRRAEFPKLTRFKDLGEGLFVGSGGDVAAVVKAAMSSADLKNAADVVAAIESDKKDSPFALDDPPKGLAYYSAAQIEKLYPKVGEAITESRAAGLKSLTQLINAHLHLTWQNAFAGGIAVVKPLPHHTTHLITPAYELAQRLAHCPETPLPDSCPPNRPSCQPCDDAKPMKTTTPPSYSGSPDLYTIGTVPHPYTSSTLNFLKPQLSIAWIRRESPRDTWLAALTSSLFPEVMSNTPRLLRFKEAVASDDDSPADPNAKDANKVTKGGAFRSLWLPAEQPMPDDLPWHFGFALPDSATYPADDTGAAPLHSAEDGPLPTRAEQALEPDLFARAQAVVLSSSTTTKKISRIMKGVASKIGASQQQQQQKASPDDLALRDAVEAWNLADTEAWRFARAYLARKTVERRRWDDEEARYAGGVGFEREEKDSKEKGEKEVKADSKQEMEEKDEEKEEKEKKEEKEEKQTAEKARKGNKPQSGGGGGGGGGSGWSRWLDRD